MARADGRTLEWVDKIADDFEQAWRSGSRPTIEPFLGASSGADRVALLVELVKLDIAYRTARGEQAKWDEYVIEFPVLGSASGNVATQRRLGDFEIIRQVGRGGMGVVYEAKQVSLGRKVALKVLSGALGLTPQAVQRFKREAEAAGRLHHTNIVPVYATGEEDGTHFYAMELIEGPSLDQIIREARQVEGTDPATQSSDLPDAATTTAPYLNTADDSNADAMAWSSSSIGSSSLYFDTVARLVADVADALDYAHRQGVIHRDIKPSNLLVSPDGRLSLNDFGLARMLEQPGMTMTGEFVGTPAYMSPEQIIAGRVPLDHRTDVYSLGATLYELLTLERPFKGEQRDQILAQIIHKEPRPPKRVNKKIPVDLETICLKALEKDPDRRYQTAGAMAEDLRRYVNRFAISAGRIGPVRRLVKLARRHPGCAAGLVGVTIATIIAALFAFDAHQAEQQRLVERELARVQLSATKREHALENALVAATSGDLDKAEKAISEAEAHGASDAQVHRLHAQVAYFRGDFKRARHQLEQALKLDPGSVAAHAMLALAELNDYEPTRYSQALAKVEPMRPETVEDYVFKGYADMWNDPMRGLQNLNEAIKRSDSPLLRCMRAGLRTSLMSGSADLKEAELAIADIQAAKEYLPDNPYVLSQSVFAKLVAANLYREANNPEKQQELLAQAEDDAHALEKFEKLVWPATMRFLYFDHVAQDLTAFEIAKRATEKLDYSLLDCYYALALYRRGRLTEALAVLARRAKDQNLFVDRLRAYLLAELHPKERNIARAACENMLTRHPSSGYEAQRILRFLGYKDDAIAISRALRHKRPPVSPDESGKVLGDYECGYISEVELLNHRMDRGLRFLSHHTVGLNRLADGDRAGAREHFLQAQQVRGLAPDDWYLARIFVERMEKDPAWPPWIPVKE